MGGGGGLSRGRSITRAAIVITLKTRRRGTDSGLGPVDPELDTTIGIDSAGNSTTTPLASTNTSQKQPLTQVVSEEAGVRSGKQPALHGTAAIW